MASRKTTPGLLALAMLLAACTVQVEPPLGLPASLSVSPSTLTGVTTTAVLVGASGPWELSVQSPEVAFTAAVSLSHYSGSGNRSVTLTVDPTSLVSGTYTASVTLTAFADPSGPAILSRNIIFSFPRVYGSAIVAAALDGSGNRAGQGNGAAHEIRPSGAARASGLATPFADEPTALASRPAGPGGMSGAAPGGQADRLTLLVGVESEPSGPFGASGQQRISSASLSALAAAAPATVSLEFPAARLVLLEVAAGDRERVAAALRASGAIRYVEEPQELFHQNDPYLPLQWNLSTIGAQQAWQTADGSGVTIAVLDNGFYPNHPDLVGNVVGTYDAGELKTDVTVTEEACGNHGTHVAGIAAAVAGNAIGIAGAAPGAGLLLIDLDAYNPGNSSCPMATDALVRALAYVVNGGDPLARVINMSIGSTTALGQAVRDALIAAAQADIVLVAASGNSSCPGGGKTNAAITYPAAYPEVLAIGATGPGDDRACYSNIGSGLFLVAPGGDNNYEPGQGDMIISTIFDIASTSTGYDYKQGTSMAAPAVAAVAALLLGAVPSATRAEVAAALAASAIDLGAPGHDPEYGHGLVFAPGALAELTGDPDPDPPPGSSGLVLRVAGYPETLLDDSGEFILVDAPTGQMLVVVGSDENENGILGETGEYYGEAWLNVGFDKQNSVVVVVERQ